jgi:hypothetical protein
MSSLKIKDSLDDHSFDTPPLSDSTGVPNFPPEEGHGDDFQPFNLEYRDFKINPLPKEPLELFQLFIPISLVQSWIEYTNSWVDHLLENAVIDNWKSPFPNTHASSNGKASPLQRLMYGFGSLFT